MGGLRSHFTGGKQTGHSNKPVVLNLELWGLPSLSQLVAFLLFSWAVAKHPSFCKQPSNSTHPTSAYPHAPSKQAAPIYLLQQKPVLQDPYASSHHSLVSTPLKEAGAKESDAESWGRQAVAAWSKGLAAAKGRCQAELHLAGSCRSWLPWPLSCLYQGILSLMLFMELWQVPGCSCCTECSSRACGVLQGKCDRPPGNIPQAGLRPAPEISAPPLRLH